MPRALRAVHGGGFHHPQKYRVAPAKLHWFQWESDATWLIGSGLFTLPDLLQASTIPNDPGAYV